MGVRLHRLLLVFCALVQLCHCDEIKVKIFHNGGDHVHKVVDTLHELGILSLELPKGDLNFIEAYIPEEHRALLNSSGIEHEQYVQCHLAFLCWSCRTDSCFV